MSLFNWFTKKSDGSGINLETQELEKLRLKDILDSHRKWKENLIEILNCDDADGINLEQIEPDHLCIEGKWLYGPGKMYSNLIEYDMALQSHIDFHQCAMNIVKACQNGNKDVALYLLDDTFRKASNKNQQDLARLLSVVHTKSA